MNDLSLHILDIAQNSIRAGATLIGIDVFENRVQNTLLIRVSDNGCGMSPEQLAHVTDPYFTSRTTRKVGMGIPLFKQNAELSGGSFHIVSTLGKGTTTTAVFDYDHFDRPPLGDVANAVVLLVSANPLLNFIYTYQYHEKEYIFDTREVKDVLEGVPLNDPLIIEMLAEMIRENCRELKDNLE